MPSFPTQFPKIPGRVVRKQGDHAVGTWAPNLRGEFEAAQSLEKAHAALWDKICHYGIRAELWQEQTPDPIQNPLDLRPGVGVCSCVTEGQRAPDKKCLTCHGTSKIGGYERFGYTYLHLASVSPQLALLNNLELDKSIKPNRILLSSGQTEGTFETTDISISNTAGFPWEADTVAFIRAQTNAIDIFWSQDAGVMFEPLQTLLAASEPPRTGKLRFRVLLRRESGTKSPAFEILRLRHRRIEVPEIRLLRNMPRRQKGRTNYGQTEETPGNNWWTMPLTFFDPSAVLGERSSRIDQESFIHTLEGALLDVRLKVVNPQYSDPKGRFMTQRFTVRRLQADEVENQVF